MLISDYLRNGARYKHSYTELLMGLTLFSGVLFLTTLSDLE